MNGNYPSNSHNAKTRIAESYNNLYASFCSDEIKQVGNYSINKLIGEGAFGKVYLAHHTLLNSKVVLKTGFKDDPNLVREVFYHRQFKHPNITKLYEVVVSDGKIWMVMEYCPGKELYDHVLSSGRIGPDEVRKLFSQIASAVYYAHSLNCIHRDLKLENILLDKKNNAKLSDFGFTRECEARSLLETVCGTTVYMAPELLQKKKYDGFKVDVWALGVILYTLLYGEMPFDEDDDLKTQYKIINEEPVYKNDIPQEGINLIQKLLKKTPSERPSLYEILHHPFLDLKGISALETSDSLLKALATNKIFNSKTERYLLKKLKSIGIDTHNLKRSVITKNCDSLYGLWELLKEKQKKSEAKRYRARSRSVLRIGESTSRRVSQFMEGSPAISRIVSQMSTNTNTGGGSAFNVPLSNHNTFVSQMGSNEKYQADTGSYNNGSAISSPEKKKTGFISKFTKLWKKKDNNQEQSHPVNPQAPINGFMDAYPVSNLNEYQQENQANRKISFSKASFQTNKKQQQQLQKAQQDQQLGNNDPLPPQNLPVQQTNQLKRLSRPPPLQEQPEQNGLAGSSEQQQQPAQLTIQEPRSPTRYVNGKPSIPRPRPTSVLSQHSIVSQFTTKSDISTTSNITARSDSRPPFIRKASSDTSLQSRGGNTTKRSLSLISSNSSNSERSSRPSSLYENSQTLGGSAPLFFKANTSAQPVSRGRRAYNEGAIFPKSFRRRKSPLGGVLLAGTKFKRSKTLIIEEEEDDDADINDIVDDEDVYEEEDMDILDGLDTDLENLGMAESTRKSSDIESDLNEERGRQLERL
jgi:serine/threonine protein kinase